jgi:hypothetical protein
MSSHTAELFNQGLDFFAAVLTQVVVRLGAPLAVRWLDRPRPAGSPRKHGLVRLVLEIPGTVIAHAHDHLDQVSEEIIRGENRAFALKAETPADATPTEKFLAWTGRQLPSASAVLRQGDLPLGRR